MFLNAILLVAFFCAVSFAQKKLTPLPANASLPETQNWLVKALEQNSITKDRNVSHYLQVIQFSGCQLNFTERVSISSAFHDSSNYSSTSTSAPMPNSGFVSPGNYSGSNQRFNDIWNSINASSTAFSRERAGELLPGEQRAAIGLNLSSQSLSSMVVSIMPARTRSANSKFAAVMIRFLDPNLLSYKIIRGSEEYPLRLRGTSIFVRKADAPFIISGIKQAAALCTAK